ncbi:MAG TPA: hypothetical protein VGJ54_01765, partial [Streptosporangiaceae bacterium]
ERPAPPRGGGDLAPGGAERSAARAASFVPAAPPPYDASPSPQSASPDGGAYASRYRDREHVNE